MKILKAFLLTLLLLAISVVIVMSAYYLFEEFPELFNDSISLIHILELINVIAYLISYLVILKFVRLNLNTENLKNKTSNLKWDYLLYILLIVIGLRFIDRPFLDFTQIIDSYSNVEIEPFSPREVSWLVSYKIFAALLIAPIFEELLFRKYIFSILLNKYSLKISIVISSLCFALIHLPNYRQLLPNFIFGVITCLIYKRTRNILYPMILHFLSNFMWFFLLLYGEKYYQWFHNLHFDFTYWAIFIFGFIFTYLGLSKITAANSGSSQITGSAEKV